MKKIKWWQPVLAVGFGLSVSVVASYPAIQNIKAERAALQEDIIKLDKSLHDALVARDFDKIDEILADDFEIYTIHHGVLSKSEWVNLIKSGDIVFHSFDDNTGSRFEGNKFFYNSTVSGKFWGEQSENYPIEMSVRTIEKKDKLQIKCLVIKEA